MEYQWPIEFAEALKKNINDNKDRNPWEVLEAMIKRWDSIRWVNAWDMIDWSNEFYNAIWQILANPVKNIDLSMFTEDELNLKEPEPEVEITDANSVIQSWWDTPVEKKELWSERNYDILKNFYERYMQLVSAKKDLVTEYNWWKWLPSGSEKKIDYENKLELLNNQLKEMENWEELHNLISSIKEDWLWERWEEWDSMPNHRLDVIMSKKSEDNEPRSWLKQNIFWNKLDDSVKWWFKIWFNERVDKYLSSKEWEHWTSWNDKEKSSSWKWFGVNNKLNSPDNMRFWEDVWSNMYLENRNNKLINYLNSNWLTSREEINSFLEKYPSWKNASQKDKDNTLNILTKWIEEKKVNKKEEVKEDKKEETKDESTNKNGWKKWNIVKEWVKNRINFETSNDSPLNWEDEEWNEFWNGESKKEDNNSLRAKQYKEKWYTVKNWKFYTPSWVLVESNWNNLSETWEWIPAKSSKSDTKNDKAITKRQEVKKTLKSSPTITWLLKSKKK